MIAGPGDSQRAGQMCRKFFYAYEKVLKAQAVIECNAVKPVALLSLASSKDSSQMLGKRTRLAASLQQASLLPNHTHNPPVFVRSTSASG